MNKVSINCYFITNALTCNDLVELINKQSLLSQIGITGLKINYDSFISDIGLKQIEILEKNKMIKNILHNSDLVGTSILKSSIENGLLLYKNTNKTIYPLPFLALNHNDSGNKELRNLKKSFTKDDKKNVFNNNNFNVESNKKYWNNVVNKSKQRKSPYNLKLNHLNWGILNSAIKNRLNINYNPKLFMKELFPKLLKKVLIKGKSEYNFTFFVNIKFILELLRLHKKKLDSECVIDIRHNSVIHLKFNYNLDLMKNRFEEYEILFPTKQNHDGYNLMDNNYYYKFNKHYYPINYKKIEKKHLIKESIIRCENHKKIIKKIKNINKN